MNECLTTVPHKYKLAIGCQTNGIYIKSNCHQDLFHKSFETYRVQLKKRFCFIMGVLYQKDLLNKSRVKSLIVLISRTHT